VSAKYIIGIDLGTTNSSLAFTPTHHCEIKQMPILQHVSLGEEKENHLLPSFIYFPLKEELENFLTTPKWNLDQKYCVGMLAKLKGSSVQNRLVSSAKSWLSVKGISKKDPLLPLDSDEMKLSPIEALSAILSHLKNIWNLNMPDAPFENQTVLITTPASFDLDLRSHIESSAKLSGYPDVILLEEPQAAFYSWLYREDKTWRKNLKANDKILVIDIGGGTTDFSLIEVKDDAGNLTLERLAVGDHLLLGGDNIDLALAYFAKGKIEQSGKSIDDFQFSQLVHKARDVKEQFLSLASQESCTLTLSSKGRKLVGSSISVDLNRDEVVQFLTNAFFPLVPSKEKVIEKNQVGLKEVGLPFAVDARITAQLAHFLHIDGAFVCPKAVLFNGGTLKSAFFQEKLVNQLNEWAREYKKSDIIVLKDPDLDFAVSKGAAYYGLARLGKGLRIKAGIVKSYFVGIESSMPAVPGFTPPIKALCVAPKGMEEGSSLEVNEKVFTLLLGQNVTFRFFSENDFSHAGALVSEKDHKLNEMTPLETHLEGEGYESVILKTTITELGSLQLFCISEAGKSWKLEFDIR
jgi:molecular chaperone DnaK (HSP70)